MKNGQNMMNSYSSRSVWETGLYCWYWHLGEQSMVNALQCLAIYTYWNYNLFLEKYIKSNNKFLSFSLKLQFLFGCD